MGTYVHCSIFNGKIIAETKPRENTIFQRSKKQCQNPEWASWGAKFDEHRNKITWFGYKIHLAVDPESELPTALEVTTASVNDGDVFPDLLQEHVRLFEDKALKYVMADAGYDQLKCYQAAKNNGAQAIIPLNLRNEKEPPEGNDLQRNAGVFHGV